MINKTRSVVDWGDDVEEEGEEVEGNVIIKLFFLQVVFSLICFNLVFYIFAVDDLERDKTYGKEANKKYGTPKQFSSRL